MTDYDSTSNMNTAQVGKRYYVTISHCINFIKFNYEIQCVSKSTKVRRPGEDDGILSN